MNRPAPRRSEAIEKEFRHFYVEGLGKRFGGLQALNNVNLTVNEGEIVGLIGPNGAGKTTLFNLVTGMDDPDAGRIYFGREFITRLPAHRIVRAGIARTFQNIRLLGHQSVLDNIKIAYHTHLRYTWVEAALRLGRFRRCEREVTDKSMEFLRIFGLERYAHDTAGALPYGMQRKLEIARALATEATLLLLDEPAAGLNPQETAELADLVREIRETFHVAILLIEHDMKLVMSLCERIYVLNFGQLIADGNADEIRGNPTVIEAYLGKEAGSDG